MSDKKELKEMACRSHAERGRRSGRAEKKDTEVKVEKRAPTWTVLKTYEAPREEGAGKQVPGVNISSTTIIDISYYFIDISYFGLVLGCIDADLCK